MATRHRAPIKIAVGLAALAVLGTLFVRSAMNISAEPYTIPAHQLAPWRVALDPEPDASGVLLNLSPPETLAPPLFTQVFRRSGLSLSGPNPAAMPLVLKREFDRGMADAVTPLSLVTLARDSGIESTQPKPLCMASRRVSQPGSTRGVFFLRFEHAPFEAFRRQVAVRLADAGVANAGFDPAGLTPVMIVAATDVNFSSWLPLRGGATDDCMAPITDTLRK